MTDGNLIRLLLGSLIKVISRRKSGGGAWDLFPLGQESCGSSAVKDGPSNNHDLSRKLSFGTSQVPGLEVRGIWGLSPHSQSAGSAPILTCGTKAPRTAGLPPPAVGSETLSACRTTLQLPHPIVLSLPGTCALSTEAKGKILKDESPHP